MSETKAQPSNVRQGLALICLGAIGVLIGVAGNQEGIAGPIGGLGLFAVLLGLAFVAWGLLRD